MFTLHKFKTRGVGIVSETHLPIDTEIGYYYTNTSNTNSTKRTHRIGEVVWYETYPFGRYINHNHNTPNLTAIIDQNGILLKTQKEITPLEELTVNYNEIRNLIGVSNEGVIDFTYVNEEVSKKTNLI